MLLVFPKTYTSINNFCGEFEADQITVLIVNQLDGNSDSNGRVDWFDRQCQLELAHLASLQWTGQSIIATSLAWGDGKGNGHTGNLI